MATATISQSNVTKKFTSAADSITVTGSSNNISTMGGIDKVTLSKGSSNTIDAGAADDIITVNGGNRHTLRGGTGSDTYIINSEITKSTRLTINQSDYRDNDADILRLPTVHMMDMSYSLKDGTLTMTHKSGGKITVAGWDKNPLSKIEFANHQATPFMDWSLTEKQINNYLALASGKVVNISKTGTYKASGSKDFFRVKGFGLTATIQGADKSDALDLSSYYQDLDDSWVEQKGNDLCFIAVKEGSGSQSSRTATIIIKDYFTSQNKLGKIATYWSADPGRWAGGYSRGMLCVVNLKYGESGTSGADWIITTKTGTYKGGAGNDMISGYGGNSYLYGDGGDDSISGGPGNERQYGGAGNDEMDGNEGNDKLWGGPGNDWMCDHEGKNELYGGTGNDVLEVSGIANQLLSGGKGSDAYYVDSVQSGATVTIDQSDCNKSDKDVLHLAFVNKNDVSYSYSTGNNGTLTVSQNSGGKITVKGWDSNPLSKIVFWGQDSMTASAVDKVLKAGNVIRISKAGTYYATKYKDIIQFSGKSWNADVKDFNTAAGEADTVKALDGDVTSVALSGENLVVTGARGASLTIEGAKGKTVSLEDSRGKYTLSSSAITLDKAFTGTMEAAKYLSTVTKIDGQKAVKKVNITGNAKNNTIYAGQAGGTYKGGAGADTIYGGKGADTLYGDGGKDTFVYADGGGKDIVKDYAAGEDILYISGGSISKTTLTSSGASPIFTVGDGTVTVSGAAQKAISLKDSRGSYTASNTAIILGKDFTGKLDTGAYLSTVTKIDGSKATKTVTVNAGSNITSVLGGSGSDKINISTGTVSVTAGSGNDTVTLKGGTASVNAGSGNDTIAVKGGKQHTLRGGAGSDTYVVNTAITKDTCLTINQSDYKADDKDTLNLARVNTNDVAYSYLNGTLTIKHSNGGTVTVKGWDVNPLAEIMFADNQTMTTDQINEALAGPVSPDPVAVTQQSVIKNFMKSLDENTTLITATVREDATEDEKAAAVNAARNAANAALSTAVNYASNGQFATWDALIESFVSDVRTYGVKDDESALDATYGDTDAYGHVITFIPESGLDRFLKNYCGIDLTNADTGSIIGADAGGAEVKTAVSIVPENGTVAELRSPEPGTTTTINGLTIHWPDADKIDNAAKQYIVDSLNTWWTEEGLNLVDEAFGLSFTEEGVTGSDMTIQFVEDEENFLARVQTHYNYQYTLSGDEKIITSETTTLNMQINMKYFNSVDMAGVDGYSPEHNSYLDRTIAHEFTHAIMGAAMERVYAGGWLPKSVTEGLAELIHGIDDTRATDIISLAKSDNADNLYQILQPNEGGNLTYAAGYMLFRYLAKQVAGTFTGQAVNESSNVIAATVADAAGGFSSSSSMLPGNAVTVSDCGESPLTVTSVRNAIIDFADTGISDSLAGVQQEDRQDTSLFVTGNV